MAKGKGKVKLPVFDEAAPMAFVELYPHSNAAMLCGAPVGFITWGGLRLEVMCARPSDYDEIERMLGKAPVGKGYHVATESSAEELAYCAWIAFGRTECSLDQDTLLDPPRAFRAAMQEAVMCFLWEGPLSNSSSEMPDDLKEKWRAKRNGSTKKVKSGTRGSGAKAAKRTTSKPRSRSK